MSKTLYLRCQSGDLAERVLLTGDPARVHTIAGLLDNPQQISYNREYLIITGEYQGQRISAVSAGIGAPSTAIALEEMAQVGVKAVVRLGTMMGVVAPMGSVVIATGAARYEGTSPVYLPLNYPAVPEWNLASILQRSGQSHSLDVHMGITATYDAFYPQMAPALVGRGLPEMAQLQRARVMATDMETALVYILSGLLGIAAVSMCLVTVQAEPFAMMDSEPRAAGETALIRAALAGLLEWQPS
jgi:uridine phosphorylase